MTKDSLPPIDDIVPLPMHRDLEMNLESSV